VVGIAVRERLPIQGAVVRYPKPADFSEDTGKQAVLCSKKSLHGFPSESVFNPSYSEVHMAQAITLQPGQFVIFSASRQLPAGIQSATPSSCSWA